MEIEKYIGEKNKILNWLLQDMNKLETGEKIIKYLLLKEWNTNLQMNWSLKVGWMTKDLNFIIWLFEYNFYNNYVEFFNIIKHKNFTLFLIDDFKYNKNLEDNLIWLYKRYGPDTILKSNSIKLNVKCLKNYLENGYINLLKIIIKIYNEYFDTKNSNVLFKEYIYESLICPSIYLSIILTYGNKELIQYLEELGFLIEKITIRKQYNPLNNITSNIFNLAFTDRDIFRNRSMNRINEIIDMIIYIMNHKYFSYSKYTKIRFRIRLLCINDPTMRIVKYIIENLKFDDLLLKDILNKCINKIVLPESIRYILDYFGPKYSKGFNLDILSELFKSNELFYYYIDQIFKQGYNLNNRVINKNTITSFLLQVYSNDKEIYLEKIINYYPNFLNNNRLIENLYYYLSDNFKINIIELQTINWKGIKKYILECNKSIEDNDNNIIKCLIKYYEDITYNIKEKKYVLGIIRDIIKDYPNLYEEYEDNTNKVKILIKEDYKLKYIVDKWISKHIYKKYDFNKHDICTICLNNFDKFIDLNENNEKKIYYYKYELCRINEIRKDQEIENQIINNNQNNIDNHNVRDNQNDIDNQNEIDNQNDIDNQNEIDNNNERENENDIENQNEIENHNEEDNQNERDTMNKERDALTMYMDEVGKILNSLSEEDKNKYFKGRKKYQIIIKDNIWIKEIIKNNLGILNEYFKINISSKSYQINYIILDLLPKYEMINKNLNRLLYKDKNTRPIVKFYIPSKYFVIIKSINNGSNNLKIDTIEYRMSFLNIIDQLLITLKFFFDTNKIDCSLVRIVINNIIHEQFKYLEKNGKKIELKKIEEYIVEIKDLLNIFLSMILYIQDCINCKILIKYYNEEMIRFITNLYPIMIESNSYIEKDINKIEDNIIYTKKRRNEDYTNDLNKRRKRIIETDCKHKFCETCFKNLIDSECINCPICRTSINFII